MALSLPLVLFLLDWWQGRRWNWPVVREKIPFLAVTVGVAGVTYLLNARLPGEQGWLSGLLIWNWTLVFYLRQFLFPLALSPVYTLPRPVLPWSLHYFLPVVVTLGLMGSLIRWRDRRLWVFACTYFFVSIFFLLRFDDVVDTNIVADRFMYLPSLGFCWLIGEACVRVVAWCRQRSRTAERSAVTVVSVIFVLMGWQTFRQARIWKNDWTMWSHALRVQPESFRVHFAMGQEHFKKGQVEQAKGHYLAALRLNPDHAWAHNNVGDILLREGRTAKALKHFAAAVRLQPANAEARNNYGTLLAKLGRHAEARSHIEAAIRLEPDQELFQISLGDVYLGQGQLDAARRYYQQALRTAPQHPIAHNRMGIVALETRDWQTAIGHFQAALRADPDYETARHNLAVAHARAAEDGR